MNILMRKLENFIYLGINLSRPKVQSPTSEVNQQTRNGVARTSSNDDSGTSDDNCVLNDKQQQLHLHQQQIVSENLNSGRANWDFQTFNYNKTRVLFVTLDYKSAFITEANKLHDNGQCQQ